MKYMKSITQWLFQRSDAQDKAANWKIPSPDSDRLFYGILSAVFLVLAFWFYHGTNDRLLAPPFGEMYGMDFRQILRASQEILNRENIYQHAIAYAESPNFSEFISWPASPYPYSPIVGVLAIPLLWIGEQTAITLWIIFSWLLLISAGVIIVMGIFEDKNWFKLLAVLLFFTMYGPSHLDLKFVNLDILILFLVSLTYYLYKRQQSGFAGIVLGFALAFKLLLAPLVAYFLWKKDWKAGLFAIGTFGALTIIGFSVAGWDQLDEFIRVNYLWSVTDMLSYPFNQSITGVGIRLFTDNPYIEPLFNIPSLVSILRVLGSITAIVLWLGIVNRRDNRDSVEGFLEFGFTLTTMLFLSPLVDDIHYLWVLMPIGGLLALISVDILDDKWKLILSVSTLLCILFLAHPDLHDAVYYGWENIAQNNLLVSRKYVLLTGAYLYGLIGLEACLLFTINYFRKRNAVIHD